MALAPGLAQVASEQVWVPRSSPFLLVLSSEKGFWYSLGSYALVVAAVVCAMPSSVFAPPCALVSPGCSDAPFSSAPAASAGPAGPASAPGPFAASMSACAFAFKSDFAFAAPAPHAGLCRGQSRRWQADPQYRATWQREHEWAPGRSQPAA